MRSRSSFDSWPALHRRSQGGHMRRWWFLTTVALVAVSALAWRGWTADAQTPVQVETVVGDLQIPWEAEFAPDGRIFLTERPGRIRIIRDGRVDPQPWAEIQVAHVGEGGLLGLALAPDFPQTRFVYVYHTYLDGGGLWNRVVRLVDRNGRGQTDKVIIDRIPGAVVHDGGRIKFGPDGKLYITAGGPPEPSQAQDTPAPWGKKLPPQPNRANPAHKPFSCFPGVFPRPPPPPSMALHPQTRTMYEAEHGPSGDLGLCCRDEINVIEAGRNYGWPEASGKGGAPR